MPCILKQRTENSPGIITFSHGEALWGLPKRSKKVSEFLVDAKRRGDWMFGIHVQGDCSHLSEWPSPEWQSFVMWSEASAPFLHNLSKDQFCPFTCSSFMPAHMSEMANQDKAWDLCVVSRAASIKRISETLALVRTLIDRSPKLRIVMVVPDMRHLALGDAAYAKQRIDRNYFELPRTLFSAKELKNISFISSSQDAFGNFPLSGRLVADLLSKSKFMMLNSHLEGVPRVICEALLVGTPCIVSEQLQSGLNGFLNATNSLKISDDADVAAAQILDALADYSRFSVDRDQARRDFSETVHVEPFKAYLADEILSAGHEVEGNWYLEDLHLRLACHGEKRNMQFFNREHLFFDWLERAKALPTDFADEDFLIGNGRGEDTPTSWQQLRPYVARFYHATKRALRTGQPG